MFAAVDDPQALPRARRALPPGAGRGVRQPGAGRPRGDGGRPVLRAPPADGGASPRPARVGGDAPPDLPGGADSKPPRSRETPWASTCARPATPRRRKKTGTEEDAVGHPSLDLSGRVAVVIGGTSGIGRALSLGLADAGADVVALRPHPGRGGVHRGRGGGQGAPDAAGHRRRDRPGLARRPPGTSVLDGLGQVDILVNSAGRIKRTPTLELPEEEWASILDTNLTGTLRACQVFAPSMLEQGRGRIVNVASLTSYVAFFEVAAYTASKAGVAGLTKALAIEWGPKGVNVNAIAPGVFRTPLNAELLDGTERGRELKLRTPLRRFGKVEECVGATVFLASEGASFINGEIIAVDGGFLASRGEPVSAAGGVSEAEDAPREGGGRRGLRGSAGPRGLGAVAGCHVTRGQRTGPAAGPQPQPRPPGPQGHGVHGRGPGPAVGRRAEDRDLRRRAARARSATSSS